MNYLDPIIVREIHRLMVLGYSQRRIARELGVHKDTVGRYSRKISSAHEYKYPKIARGSLEFAKQYVDGQIAYLTNQKGNLKYQTKPFVAGWEFARQKAKMMFASSDIREKQ